MSMKQRKTNIKESVQTYLPIGEIRENCVVLKEGGIRAVVQVSSVNFQLKSEDEQMATLDSYQQFLNTLDFPIQIVMQSRKVDLDTYFQILEKQTASLENPLLKHQAKDYEEFLKKITEHADIMEKKFYVVVPSDPLRTEGGKGILSQFFSSMAPNDSLEKIKTRYLEFQSLYEVLKKRTDIVSSGLERCGLRVKTLNTQDLISLYYNCYNPFVARMEKLQDVREYSVR